MFDVFLLIYGLVLIIMPIWWHVDSKRMNRSIKERDYQIRNLHKSLDRCSEERDELMKIVESYMREEL